VLRGTGDHVSSEEHGNTDGGEMYVCVVMRNLAEVDSSQVLPRGR